MDYEQLKKLMDDFGASNLTSIELELPSGEKVKLTKDDCGQCGCGCCGDKECSCDDECCCGNCSCEDDEDEESVVKKSSNKKSSKSHSNKKAQVEQDEEEDGDDEMEGEIIKSPMVGTFYSKPSPDAKAFVEVGSSVKKGQTVCIVEAMKLMNEIESEFDGKILEVLVKDGDVVEYGTPLYRVGE